MLPAFLLSLREGLEAALIIGIVLGALSKIDRPSLKRYAWTGTLTAVLVSILAAIFLTAFGLSLEGDAEAIFEGLAMLLAALVLTWMIFWMNRQARSIKSDIEADVRQAALASTGGKAIFFLAFIAILREGIELALFLTAATFTSDAVQTVSGAILGLGAAAIMGYILFASTIRLNLRLFFQVTSFLLILFAAGLVAHAVHELNEVGWIPSIIEHVWDTNFILNETSLPGMILTALFGYNANPSLTEVLAYIGYFVAILTGLRLAKIKAPTVPASNQISEA
jgi:high-affinity iron transporter